MARRRAHYGRRNKIKTSELVVGGLVATAVVGLGGYFLYSYFQNQSGASSNAGLLAANAGQQPLPGGTGAPTASQVSASQLSSTPSTAS